MRVLASPPGRALLPDVSFLEDGQLTVENAPVPSKTSDTIPLARDRKLRVVDTRLDEGTDGDPVSGLVVEPA
jgi:hypothetical protein